MAESRGRRYRGAILVPSEMRWQVLDAGELVLGVAEAVFWYRKGLFRPQTIEFSVPYHTIHAIEAERVDIIGGDPQAEAVVFRFLTLQVCPGDRPLDVMELAFRPLKVTGRSPDADRMALECRDQISRWYREKREELADAVFTQCKVTGRFSVAEGVALYSSIVPPGVGNAHEEVSSVIVNLIKSGRLDGFFDEESGQYTAAALAPRRVTQVSVDFNSLLAALGEKGIVLQHLTCPSCGGKLSLPQGGDLIECEYCGAAVRAVDMFEKFKGLLGL